MNNRFDISETPIQGLKLIRRKPIGDSRGYLERLFCTEDLTKLIPENGIVQINHSLTAIRGAVRGLHFQYPPRAEIKIVTCLRGEVFDVAVDLRADSPNFLKWHGEVLSPANKMSLFIPEGCAHGFQTLCEDCELLYLHTAAYAPDHEGAVRWDDPLLDIKWPLPVSDMSERDRNHSLFDDTFKGICI